MVRSQGYDPEQHWNAYAASFKKLDQLGIVLDCDPRKTNNSGQAQSTGDSAVSTTKTPGNGAPKNGVKKPATTADDTAS
jgi:capsid protein